ncbi:MAG: SCP2 sterol-binding domain-containing protein [Deltaproteobacteria bacterium]|nr:SCP2 sterol-binding domain-containing protein [Deltaproteobacteria bacterium]MCB9786844.1 SCP2 sterol-binding domain-containing protein [Deltaproteobacteria bacterium]
MTELAHLPADITPQAFIEAVRAAMADETVPPTASAQKAVLVLDGDGGGSWTMGFEDGKLKIEEGVAAAPPVRATSTVESWRHFVAGRVRDRLHQEVDVSLFDPRGLLHLFHDGARVEKINAFHGDLRLVLEDTDAGDEYSVTITLGGGAPNLANPTTTVRISMDDAAALARREENLQTAFFSGKIRLEGDLNLPMGIMAAMMS